jgi:hypothetical protein
VPAGAVSISWLLCNGFGQHPADIDQDRDVAALAELAAALLDGDRHLPPATSNRTKENKP